MLKQRANTIEAPGKTIQRQLKNEARVPGPWNIFGYIVTLLRVVSATEARRARRRLAPAQLIALIGAVLIGTMASASTSDVVPSDVATPNLGRRAEELGADSVNSRTGAASYSYAFTLPPARGVGATLGLSYSSSGAVRGDVAAGWTLGPIMSISRDVSRERDATPVFVGMLGGGPEELVATPSDQTASGGTAYRARIDRNFTRFEMSSDHATWTARTTSGEILYFGENGCDPTGASMPTARSAPRWPIRT
jgi:hypothetical protein